MNKLGLLLAGAALFDLGTVVASSHAASADMFLKIELDATHTASACTMNGGTVITSGGAKFCQTKKEAPKAPAKKDEARKK